MRCKKCGQENITNANFCKRCGAGLNNVKSKLKPGLLILIMGAILLGGAIYIGQATFYPKETMTSVGSEQLMTKEKPSTNVSAAVTDNEYYNLNIFTSNFTEAGLESYTLGNGPADELLPFAYEQNWFNKMEVIEWSDDGYFGQNGCNTRIAKKDIDHTLRRFFGEAMSVNALTGLNTVENYVNEYYYGEETGGNMPNGFALLKDIEKKDDTYQCSFDVYGTGCYESTDKKYYSWTEEQAEREFGPPSASSKMQLKADQLADRKTYTLLKYELTYD